MTRVRVRFTKTGKIRWTSHRDLARMWERAFRRVHLPLVYTGGFSPRPRVSFGLALPTGHESVAEYLDLDLLEPLPGDQSIDVDSLCVRLSAALPSGLDATVAAVIDPGAPSLQEVVSSSTWRLIAAPAEGAAALTLDQVSARVQALMVAPSAVVTRLRKGVEVTDDLRPSILSVRVTGPVGPDPAEGIWLEGELASKPRTVRPSELLLALGSVVAGTTGPCFEERDVRRLHQWILRDGARSEPLSIREPDVATDAPHAYERVS